MKPSSNGSRAGNGQPEVHGVTHLSLPEEANARDDQPNALLVTRTTAPRLLGISRRTFDRHAAAGLIGPAPIRLGKRMLYRVDELREWIGSVARGRLPDRATWQARVRAQVGTAA